MNIGSSAHRVEDFGPADPDLAHGYSAVGAYARSKAALVAWSLDPADRLRASGIDVVALCPGLNNTRLSAAMTGGIGGPPANGAALVVHAGTSADPTGGYAENGRPAEPSPAIQSPAYRRDVANVIAARLLPQAERPTIPSKEETRP